MRNSCSRSFNQDIGAWNIGAVTDMSYMFHLASSFRTLAPGTSKPFHVHYASSFNQQLDLSGVD